MIDATLASNYNWVKGGNMDQEQGQQCTIDPDIAVKMAFEASTGKRLDTITGDEPIPADRIGFFAIVKRFQEVLQIDIETATSVTDLINVLRLKRAYPHCLE